MENDVSPSQDFSNKTGKKNTIFLLVLLAVSLSFNVFLGWNLQRLKNTLRDRSDSTTLSAGVHIPPVTASDLFDREKIITYTDVAVLTVLYAFSPACIWCTRNLDNIMALASLRGNSHRFIGLSLSEDKLKEYVETHELNFPIYQKVALDSIRELGLGSTPQTIVISPDGKVLNNWKGAYGKNLRPQVEAYFDIRLPGLRMTEKSGEGASSSQSCTHCIRDGLLYSVGSVIKTGNRQLRCNKDGRWIEQ